MPITRDEGNALAELLHVVRPSWDTAGIIRRGLAPLLKHPAPLEVIAWAALRAAADPDNRTPAVIPLNGHHWNLADRPPVPRLTPEHECPTHPGKWAGNCPLCHADRIGRPDDPPADDGLSHLGPRERAREAARRAKTALHDPGLHDSELDPRQRPHHKPDTDEVRSEDNPNLAEREMTSRE